MFFSKNYFVPFYFWVYRQNVKKFTLKTWKQVLQFGTNVYYFWFKVIIQVSTNQQRKYLFLLAGRKVHFIAPCGANKSIFFFKWEKNRIQHGKNVYFTCVYFSPWLHNIIPFHSNTKHSFKYWSIKILINCPNSKKNPWPFHDFSPTFLSVRHPSTFIFLKNSQLLGNTNLNDHEKKKNKNYRYRIKQGWKNWRETRKIFLSWPIYR